MGVADPRHAWERLLLAIALVFAVYVATLAFDHGVCDIHPFRQTQTALSARYLGESADWLHYETPVLGAPWSIPMEFPLYQGLAAGLQRVAGLSLEASGRTIGLFFHAWSVVAFVFVLRALAWPRRTVWLGAAFFLASPLYAFWSRTFMIESTALCFGLAYLAFGMRALRRRALAVAVAALVCGIVCALVKVTTLFGFSLALALSGWRLRPSRSVPWARCAVLLALPAAAAFAWTAYADAVKELNPLARDFLTSRALTAWNFGPLAQRFDGAVWTRLFNENIRDTIGQGNVLVVLVAALPAIAKRARREAAAATALFVAPLLVFTNLHYVHNYYTYANGVFLIAAAAAVLGALAEAGGRRAVVAALLSAGLIGNDVFAYWTHQRHAQTEPQVDLVAEAAAVRAHTTPTQVVAVFGETWSPKLPYLAERRAVMDPRSLGLAQPELAAMISSLHASIGAVAVCAEARATAPALLAGLAALGVNTNPQPVFGGDRCDLYAVPSSVDRP